MKASELLVLLTFPGVVIHEFAHKQLCDWYRIQVKEICYFRLGNPAGYVTHSRPKRYFQAFMISLAPVFINTLIAVLAGVGIAVFLFPDQGVSSITDSSLLLLTTTVVTAWVGVSAGMHSLPSSQDVSEIWDQTRSNWYNPIVFTVVPIILVVELLNWVTGQFLALVYGCVLVTVGAIIAWYPGDVVNLVQSIPV
jgi:hypothetical protein